MRALYIMIFYLPLHCFHSNSEIFAQPKLNNIMSSRTKAIILKNRSLEFLLLYRQNYAYIGESDVHFYADSCMSCLEYVHYAAVDVQPST